MYIRWFVILMVLFLPVCAVAQETSNRDKAKALNRQAVFTCARLTSTTDSAQYYHLVHKSVQMAFLSDYYCSKNSDLKTEGKIRKSNRRIIASLYTALSDGAMYFHSKNDDKDAKDCLTLCMDVAENRMYADVASRNSGKIAYYAALLAFGDGEYANAARYADVAMRDTCYRKEASEIKIASLKQNLVTEADSSNYLVELLKLYSLDKGNRSCFRMLMDYFSSPGHEKEMDDFAEDELRNDSTDRLAWALKGEGLMRKSKWTEAVDAYSKAVILDSTFVEAVYNIGICYCARARETRSVDDLTAGIAYLERASRLDHGQTKVKWGIPLRKAKEILNEYRIKVRKTDNE